MKRRSEFASLADVGRRATGRAAAAVSVNATLARLRVFNAWGRAVGEGLRTVTRPSHFENGTLHVDLLDAKWLPELRRLEDDILARVHEAVPADRVRRILYSS